MLAEDAVFYTDGGGKRRSALKPIQGKAKILRFYEGVRSKADFNVQRMEVTTLNGLSGFVFHTGEGTETMAFKVAGGLIVAIYCVRNLDKLRHLS